MILCNVFEKNDGISHTNNSVVVTSEPWPERRGPGGHRKTNHDLKRTYYLLTLGQVSDLMICNFLFYKTKITFIKWSNIFKRPRTCLSNDGQSANRMCYDWL